MTQSAKELGELIWENYVPSSIERKKALLMYIFVGILVALSKWKVSKYEKYHLKQAIGWWMLFFLFLIISSVLLFLPIIRFLPILIFIGLIVILGVFVKQAREGYFVMWNKWKIFFPLFSGLGEWMLEIFEINEEEEEEIQNEVSQSDNTSEESSNKEDGNGSNS